MGMTRVNLPDSHSSDVADEENLAPPSGLNEVLFENPAAKGSDDDGGIECSSYGTGRVDRVLWRDL
eukprot:COSAG02_NODE_4697_length_5084_cov_1.990572_6_plen_65_part_01